MDEGEGGDGVGWRFSARSWLGNEGMLHGKVTAEEESGGANWEET